MEQTACRAATAASYTAQAAGGSDDVDTEGERDTDPDAVLRV